MTLPRKRKVRDRESQIGWLQPGEEVRPLNTHKGWRLSRLQSRLIALQAWLWSRDQVRLGNAVGAVRYWIWKVSG